MVPERGKNIITATLICIMTIVLTAAPSLLVATPIALAECHCYTVRSFDSSHPGSADLYVLTTARNSLLAAAAGITKVSVVRMRIKGTDETDLWLSLYLQSAWGSQDEASEPFTYARKRNDRHAMAEVLADGALMRTFRVEKKVLSQLRNAGAETSEITLSLLVSSRARPSPMEVFKDVRSGKTTWGKILSSIGIAPGTTGDLVEAQVRRAREQY